MDIENSFTMDGYNLPPMANNLQSGSIAGATLGLVLAGGRGTRLGGLTHRRAKPAVPFGGKYRLIDFALSNSLNSGLGKIGVLTQYMSHSLNQHILQGWRLTTTNGSPLIELLPAQQGPGDNSWYAGTADALYQNLEIIQSYRPRYVLVLAGDHIYQMDYRPMLEQHAQSGADVTVCAIESDRCDASRFGVLGIDEEHRVRCFKEKPEDPACIPGKVDKSLISMGIYVFNADFLYDLLQDDHTRSDSEHDFGKNIIPNTIEHHDVRAFVFKNQYNGENAYWRDVGTIDAYYQANQELLGILPSLNLYDQNWPIRTFATQSPPAKFLFDTPDRCGAAVNSMICDGCIISGALVNQSLLSTNVTANQHTEINNSVLLPEVNIGERCRIRNAIVDRGCHVPSDTTIGYDPDGDRQRFEVTDSGIVLVTTDAFSDRKAPPAVVSNKHAA